MKKLLFFLFLLIPFMVQAQTYYKCIGNNVKLRKGPGNHYKFEHLFCQGEDTDTPAQMSKGEIVKYTGKQRNGYKKVESVWGECSLMQCCYSGWVSSQYIKPAARCPNCKGARVCKRCPPEQCIHKGFAWCFRTNTNVCTVCDGVGWL